MSTALTGQGMTRCFVIALISLLAAQGIAVSQIISKPSAASVKEDLHSDDDLLIDRALVAVLMYKLPLPEDVFPLLDNEQDHNAYFAYLAAGGDETVLSDLLRKAEIDEDDRKKCRIATALLFSKTLRDRGLMTLVTMALDSDIDARRVIECLGGNLSSQAMQLLIQTLARSQNPTNFLDDVELFPLAKQMRIEHWSGLKSLLINPHEQIRFLAAQWMVNGDFDGVDESELNSLLRSEDPMVQAAAATLLVRQNRENLVATKRLRELLLSQNTLARRIAIAGIGTISKKPETWLPLLLPSLVHNDYGVSWTAEKIVDRVTEGNRRDVARFLNEHLDEISDTVLYHLISSFEDEDRSEEVHVLWAKLVRHSHRQIRRHALQKVNLFMPRSEVIDQLLECLKDPSADIRFEALNRLKELDIAEAEIPKIAAQASILLQDKEKPRTMGSASVRIGAAGLLWKLKIRQSEIFSMEKQLLTSGKQHDVYDGLELLKQLKGDAAPLLPVVFDVACQDGADRDHVRHLLDLLQPKSGQFLMEMLKSPNAQQRGTALYLLVGSPPTDQVMSACLALLDDEATYSNHHFFGSSPEKVNQTAANLLAYWVSLDPSVAKRLRSNDVALSKLKALLSEKQQKLIENPRPGIDDIVQNRIRPSYWDVDDVLSESELLGCFAVRKVDSAGRASPELQLEFLDLTERVMPMVYDSMLVFTPEYIFEDLESKNEIDDRLIAALEHWLEVPFLDSGVRLQAAKTLLRFRPDSHAAKTFVRLDARDFNVIMYGSRLSQ
jgi:HEAT repeat protein